MTTETETAPAARGTKLEQAQRALAERRAELDKINALVHDSWEAEEEARLNELRAAPNQRTGAVGSTSQKIRATRERNEKKAEDLGREISARERLVAELSTEQFELTIVSQVEQAAKLKEAQLAGWKVFVEKVVAAHVAFTDVLLPALEAMDEHVVSTEGSHRQIVDSEAWTVASAPAVSPVPVDFLAALEMVFQTACDTFGRGYRGEGERMDDGRVLVELVPDLRASNRAAVLSGKTAKKSSSAFFAYGNQPVGSGPEIVRAERDDGLRDWHR